LAAYYNPVLIDPKTVCVFETPLPSFKTVILLSAFIIIKPPPCIQSKPAPDNGPLGVNTLDKQDPRHKTVAIAEWLKSGKICTLVGDWHSHPNGGFSPSSIDKNT